MLAKSSLGVGLSRPKLKSFCVRLLRGGAGARISSMPFLRDAPGGRSTVSTVEVDDINVGSEISALETVFFRRSCPPDLAVIGAGREKFP